MQKFLFLMAFAALLSCQSHHLQTVDRLKDPVYLTSERYAMELHPETFLPKDCYSEANVDPEILCIQQHDPVCGCDGKTYTNVCHAEKAGIMKHTKGVCPPAGVNSPAAEH